MLIADIVDDEDSVDEDRPDCFGTPGITALSAMLTRNFVVRHIPGWYSVLPDLRSHYRVPRVRFIARTRALCQEGRCRAACSRGELQDLAWLCERAPLWVVVHVCALLRER